MISDKDKITYLSQFVVDNRLQRIENVLKERKGNIHVVLENVRNDHNVSAVLRSADAFGIQNVHVIEDSIDVSRGVALGTEQWLTITEHQNSAQCLEHLNKEGFELVVLKPAHLVEGDKKSVSVFELPFNEKLALVFGNEHKGVSTELSKAASYYAHIPMHGFVESLNISVAAAITRYCSTISSTPPHQLSQEEETLTRLNWLEQSVKNSDKILKKLK